MKETWVVALVAAVLRAGMTDADWSQDDDEAVVRDARDLLAEAERQQGRSRWEAA